MKPYRHCKEYTCSSFINFVLFVKVKLLGGPKLRFEFHVNIVANCGGYLRHRRFSDNHPRKQPFSRKERVALNAYPTTVVPEELGTFVLNISFHEQKKATLP